MVTKQELDKFIEDRTKALWASFGRNRGLLKQKRAEVEEARKVLERVEEEYITARDLLEREFIVVAQAQYFKSMDMQKEERCPKCEGELELKETGDPVGLRCKAACGWEVWHPVV